MYFFFFRDYIPFFASSNEIHLVKMRLPFDGVNIPICEKSSFGDNSEFAFFGAYNFGGTHFFIFKENLLWKY